MSVPRRTLREALLQDVAADLAGVDALLDRCYPGEPASRQPVHTAYVPADRFTAAVGQQWGEQARRSLDDASGSAEDFGRLLGLSDALAAEVHPRVADKLRREPIEDLRIDFEDGYGRRSDEEEDAEVQRVAGEIGGIVESPCRPAYVGARIKPLEAATRDRAVRTLDLLVTALVTASALPDGFVVTLPKVSMPPQVAAMARLCGALESALDLAPRRLTFEIQIEMPQAVIGPDGKVTIAALLDAAEGRCTGLHYGTYDYSAACGVAAAYQSMDHPAADYAKAVMQAAAAGTGVRLSDGSTNVLPVGDRAAVRAGWRLHAGLVRRSLERAFYQGWDLHPAQLPSRYAATYAFYREGLGVAAARLQAYVTQAQSGVLDEPATAQALAGYLLRGLDCGAVDPAEVSAATNLDRAGLERLRRRADAGAGFAQT
jgi:citrate lyase beta subunit